MLNRVVVTGMGVLCPSGNNVDTLWNNVVAGHSPFAAISRFDALLYRTRFAGELSDFNVADHLEKAMIKKMDLFTQYALICSDQAIKDAGFDAKAMNPFDIGVIWGSGQGGMDTFEKQVTEYVLGDGHPRFSPYMIPKFIANMSSGMISIRHGFMGLNYTTTSACATSNTAIMDAFNYIRLGKAKIIVTGCSEAPITPAVFGGFSALKAMSARNDDPTKASRPFDTERDGFVMSEGGGALILEDYEHAKQRGAHIYGEIVGAAMTADAYHITSTHPEGKGIIQAMKFALQEARINFTDVDYINPHATSTPVGDIAEAKAMGIMAGSGSNDIAISATKSVTGHLLGAAGLIEAIICLKSIRHNVVPGTANTTHLDPAIPSNLRIITGDAIDKQVAVTMSNNIGFGGHNATVIFRKV